MADEFGGGSLSTNDADNLSNALDQLAPRIRDLERGANAFAGAMARAFSSSIVGGKSFDDVLRSLALRMSDIALRLAFKPIERSISSGLTQLFGGIFGGGSGQGGGAGLAAAMGAVKPFAGGGVIGTPTYFPLLSGGVGLAGEAGPEAILPLARGPDGRLGVASGGGAPTNVTIHISTPDADSFRRSEVYLTGQIARAVARGQRGL
jgi:phage-related minor tail protein